MIRIFWGEWVINDGGLLKSDESGWFKVLGFIVTSASTAIKTIVILLLRTFLPHSLYRNTCTHKVMARNIKRRYDRVASAYLIRGVRYASWKKKHFTRKYRLFALCRSPSLECLVSALSLIKHDRTRVGGNWCSAIYTIFTGNERLIDPSWQSPHFLVLFVFAQKNEKKTNSCSTRKSFMFTDKMMVAIIGKFY